MKLIFKQRFFTFLDSYDVFDENDRVIYKIEGEFSLGKCLHIYSASGEYLATVKQKLLTWMPTYEIYIGEDYAGVIKKKFSLFSPAFEIDYLGWSISGDFFEWDYTIYSADGDAIAYLTKELFRLTDTYVINVKNRDFALNALALVIAIDAEKDSRN